MKKKYVVIIGIIFIILFMIILLLLLGHSQKVAITEIKELRYRHNASMMANGDIVYELTCEDTKCIASYKPSGVDDKDKYQYPVDTEFCLKLENLLEKYDVGSWDGFDKSDPHVLDGSSFSFDVTMINGDTINAYGYMKYPKHYQEFVSDLKDLYKTLP